MIRWVITKHKYNDYLYMFDLRDFCVKQIQLRKSLGWTNSDFEKWMESGSEEDFEIWLKSLHIEDENAD